MQWLQRSELTRSFRVLGSWPSLSTCAPFPYGQSTFSVVVQLLFTCSGHEPKPWVQLRNFHWLHGPLSIQTALLPPYTATLVFVLESLQGLRACAPRISFSYIRKHAHLKLCRKKKITNHPFFLDIRAGSQGMLMAWEVVCGFGYHNKSSLALFSCSITSCYWFQVLWALSSEVINLHLCSF